ncbi:hypothetical protein RSAG8_12174, partial [Rhizoctonia solani AG-8 WAC10335]
IYLQLTLGYTLGVFSLESVLETSIAILFTSTIFLVAALSQAKAGNVSELDSYILHSLSFAPVLMVALRFLAALEYEGSNLRSRQQFGHRYYLTRATGSTLSITYIILWCVWFRVAYSRRMGSSEDPPDTECSPSENFVIVTMNFKHEKAGREDIDLVEFYLTAVLSGLLFLVDLRQLSLSLSQTMWNKSNQESTDQSGDESNNDRNLDNNNKSDEDGGTEGQEGGIHIVEARKLTVTAAPFHRFSVKIIFGVLAIYQLGKILGIEKTIAANNVPTESNIWSYGQITALSAAILQSISSLYQFILKWRAGKEKGSGLQETNPEP